MKETIIDIGNELICDFCSEDFTNSNVSGGLLYSGWVACPTCANKIEANEKATGKNGRYIKNKCPESMSFTDWSLSLRNGDNRIIIRSQP